MWAPQVAHALSAAGAAALPALLDVLSGELAAEEGWWVTCACASVIGAIGHVRHL